ncbi:sulfatase-like hydrolase/transferase [Nibrella saemangeumensis]|uniref:Sulfatase-like hydrolase/transferase n=1 Tax=Nibrella saemangeumensis TaxID=1084526 RepID=A0ABP8NNR8_9BACT
MKIILPLFLGIGLLAILASRPTIHSNPDQRPNVLWIMAEDMNLHLGCYGEKLVYTPNVDWLAKHGVRYDHAFTVAGVCAPSRAAIITGMYSTAIGTQHMRQAKSLTPYPGVPFYNAVPPPAVKALPEYLRQAGYFCTNNLKTDYQFGTPFTVWDDHSNTAHWRNRPDPAQPFFSVFTFEITHEINVWPDSTKWRFFREFGVDTARLVRDVRRRPAIPDRHVVRPQDVTLPPYYPDDAVVRSDYARHLTNINRMDTQVGQLLNQLREDKLLDNTIIVFMGDNGDGMPRAKRWLTDSGIRVPLIVYIPDVLKKRYRGQTTGLDRQLVSFIDLAPTMAGIVGIEPPAHWHGRAFLSLKPLTKPRQYIHAARDRMDDKYDRIRAVRDSRYTYIRNFNPELPYTQKLDFQWQMPMMQRILALEKAGKLTPVQSYWLFNPKPVEELYDAQTDPHQVRNLAGNPAYKQQLTALRTELNRWLTQTGDWGAMPETEQAGKMWPGGRQPVTADPAFGRDAEGRLVIQCATEGASIGYQLPGETRWRLYTGPLSTQTPVEVKAVRYGWAESALVTSP